MAILKRETPKKVKAEKVARKTTEPEPRPQPEVKSEDVYISGVRPKLAIIEGPAGRDVRKIKPSETTDFSHKGIRYVYDPAAIKLRPWIILHPIALVYTGAMFFMFGVFGNAPPLTMFGVINLLAAFMFQSAKNFLKETYSLYFEGQSKPVKFLSHPALMLPQPIVDKNGKYLGMKNIDGATFDGAVAPHAFEDLSSEGPKILTWDKMKWVVYGVVALVVIYGLLSYGGVI